MLAIKTDKIWDKLIVLFIVLLAGGRIGGALTLVRIFVICCVPFMIKYPNSSATIRHNTYERIFLIGWVIYAFCMLLISIDFLISIKYFIHLTLNIYAFFVLIWIANKAIDPQKAITQGWIIMFLVTLPIALWEFYTDQHLPWALQESDSYMEIGNDYLFRRFASIAFGNLNAYNYILCYVLPFIIYAITSMHSSTNKSIKFFSWIVLIMTCLVLTLNSSRAAILCLALELGLALVYFLRHSKKLLVILGILIYLVLYLGDKYDLFIMIFSRFDTQGFEDTGRLENIIYGIEALIDSNLLGVGIGNYHFTMQEFGLDITAPHNVFLEVGVQFGIFILVGYVFLLYKILKTGIKNPSHANKLCILMAIISYPIVHIINSGCLLNTEFWLFLASILIIADKRYNKLNKYDC